MYNFFMFYTSIGILIRILSNSYLNVFQKILANKGQKSSVINMYTYLGICIFCIWFLKSFSLSLIPYAISMGFLGALSNYFIIKALSIGELSILAPINSYKPIVAMVFGILFLNEKPSLVAILSIILIIIGTYFILDIKKGNIQPKAILYRVLALIFSGIEAVVIKHIIILTSPLDCFIIWAIFGFLVSALFVVFSKNKPIIKSYKYQLMLIISVGIMQYSTNFVFARMNVAYALALFQMSTLLSVFLGANIFKETNLKRKIIGSIIMIIGAVILILLPSFNISGIFMHIKNLQS